MSRQLRWRDSLIIVYAITALFQFGAGHFFFLHICERVIYCDYVYAGYHDDFNVN